MSRNRKPEQEDPKQEDPKQEDPKQEDLKQEDPKSAWDEYVSRNPKGAARAEQRSPKWVEEMKKTIKKK